jgi:hypothetical protein
VILLEPGGEVVDDVVDAAKVRVGLCHVDDADLQRGGLSGGQARGDRGRDGGRCRGRGRRGRDRSARATAV